MSSKERAQVRRQTVLMAILGGPAVFAAIRWGIQNPHLGTPFRSVFFGSATHWPGFVKSFLPLDIALTCFFVGALFYALTVSMAEPQPDVPELRGWVRPVAVMSMCLGMFGGVMGSTLFGWYRGLELFVVMTAVAIVFVVAILILGAGMDMVSDVVAKVGKSFWSHAKTTPAAKPALWLGRYLRGEDKRGGSGS